MLNKSISISYIDMLWALAALFIVLFIVSKSEEQTKGNIIDPSQFIIEMTWQEDSVNDVDLWVANPNGEISFFRDREIGGITLDMDNTGINSYVKDSSGEMKRISTRREVANIRGVIPGTYIVNAMMFANRDHKPEKIKITVKKLNPYQEVIEREFELLDSGTEATAVQITVDADGKVTNVSQEKVNLFSRLRG